MSAGEIIASVYVSGIVIAWLIGARFTQGDGMDVAMWAIAWPMIAMFALVVSPVLLSGKLLPLVRPMPPDESLASIEAEIDRELAAPTLTPSAVNEEKP